MREDARWLAVYGAAFVALWEDIPFDDNAAARWAKAKAERLADAELSARSKHPFPKGP